MEIKDLVGKEVIYRPLWHNEMKRSKIVSFEEFDHFEDGTVVLLTLEDGAVVAPTACYFVREG